jgi:hypothetical protein
MVRLNMLNKNTNTTAIIACPIHCQTKQIIYLNLFLFQFKSQIELDGYEKLNNLLAKSINLATFLNYLVSESTESPKYLVRIHI